MKLTGVVTYAPLGPGGQRVTISLDPAASDGKLEFPVFGRDSGLREGDFVKVEVKKA